jgi:uroporphyrinogen-III synthase
MLALAAVIDDRDTRLAVEAERSFLSASGGGCRAPIGALAAVVGDELDLLGGYASPDGAWTTIAHRRGRLGSGDDLAREISLELDSATRVRGPASTAGREGQRSCARRVLVTRAVDQAGELVSGLRDAGLDAIPVPAIALEFDLAGRELDSAARVLHTYAWVVVTSANGARAILKAAERAFTPLEASRFAALGSATRSVLEHEGIAVDFQPSQSDTIAMAAELSVGPGDEVLIVRGDLADEELAVALRARGALVDDVVAYRTHEAPESSRGLLRRATEDGPIAAAVFTSGSTVRGLLALGYAESIDVRSFPAVCIGPKTADEARTAGFRILAVSPTPDSAALAATTARALALQEGETP